MRETNSKIYANKGRFQNHIVDGSLGVDPWLSTDSICIPTASVRRFDKSMQRILSRGFIPLGVREDVRCNSCNRQIKGNINFVLRLIHNDSVAVIDYLGETCGRHDDKNTKLYSNAPRDPKEHSNYCSELRKYSSDLTTVVSEENGIRKRFAVLEDVSHRQKLHTGNLFYGEEWNRKKRMKVRRRDGFGCQECGMTQREHMEEYGQRLDVHHIEKRREFLRGKEANRMDNLELLCRKCHARKDTR